MFALNSETVHEWTWRLEVAIPSVQRGRKRVRLDLHAAESAYWPQMSVRTSVCVTLVGLHTLTAQGRLRLIWSHVQSYH